jgi:hypothetical protein
LIKKILSRPIGAALLLVLLSPQCYGQNSSRPPIRADVRTGLLFTVSGGAGGVVSSDSSTRGALQFGAGLGVSPPDTLFGVELEGGYVGSVANASRGAGVFSANYRPSWTLNRSSCVTGACPLAFATAGYSRLVGTGNALDFGGGLDYYFAKSPRALRVEVRDYMTWQAPQQHNVALRIGLVIVLAD